MLSLTSFALNIIYTATGLLISLISMPQRVRLMSKPLAFVINVKSFWWVFGYMRNSRAMTIGHVVLGGPTVENKDLEHELIHVEQYCRIPLIFPFLYYSELIMNGYKNNKYEIEAYKKAGNTYREPLS